MPAARTGRPGPAGRTRRVKKSGGRSCIRVRSSSPERGWSSTILMRAPGIALAPRSSSSDFSAGGGSRSGRSARTASPMPIDALGHVPLPPYIHRPDRAEDRERYQTVFARERGSVAAPTAGLHFDDALVAPLGGGRHRLGDGDTARRLRHVQAGSRRSRRGSPRRSRTVRRSRRRPLTPSIAPAPAAAASWPSARRRRARSRARRRADGRRRAGAGDDGPVHPPRPPLSRRRRAADELPPAAVVAAYAGGGLCRAATSCSPRTGMPLRKGFRFYSYGDAMLIV